MLFFGWMSWGPVQFRVSEALTVLALFTPYAVVGLGLGCVVANLVNIPLSGVGALGMLDVVFGSVATVCGAAFTWHFRERRALAVAGPVLANALIVPAYLPWMLSGMGFYTIPFTSIDLEGSYAAMYVFGLVATGFGEAVVMYLVGLPLAAALEKTGLVRILAGSEEVSA